MNNRGDTLIEVLLAIAALTLIVSGSFAVANRSLALGRNAQERVEALKLASEQVELLKSANPQLNVPNENDPGGVRCVTANNNGVVLASGNACTNVNGSFYSIQIFTRGDTIISRTTWQIAESAVGQQVELAFRL